MRHSIVIILAIAWLGTAIAQEAESPRYHVELIVFQHLDSTSSPHIADKLNDYRSAADIFTADDISADSDTAIQPLPVEARLEKSPAMGTIWRKLRNSAGYRPLLYAGWVQPSIDINAEYRVRLHSDTPLPDIDSEVHGGIAGAVSEPHYTLDGWASFSKGRFFHLKMDLEWRQRLHDPIAHPDLDGAAFSVYNLNQQRQIRAAQIEYFDSPWLAVLAKVTELQTVDPGG